MKVQCIIMSFRVSVWSLCLCSLLALSGIVRGDERLSLLAGDDDSAGGRDPRLQLRLPADGKYFLIVQDAHDTGGEMHPYHLIVR